MLNLSDLQIDLTVPLILSWSLLNAMACGCTVLGSSTAMVREVVTDGNTRLLVDFFDVDGFGEKAVAMLVDPASYRHLGELAVALVRERYALGVTLPMLFRWFERTIPGNLP